MCPLVLKRGSTWPFQRSKNYPFFNGESRTFYQFLPLFPSESRKEQCENTPLLLPFQGNFFHFIPYFTRSQGQHLERIFFLHFANSYKPLRGSEGRYPYYFFHGHFGIKTPLILYNADKRNAKNTLISEFADKTVRAVSANYWRKSPKTHPNWNDHEYHSVIIIGSGHTGFLLPSLYLRNLYSPCLD